MIWPLLCGTGLTWLIAFFFMPETNADSILTHRARVLRRITGNANIHSRGEDRDAQLTLSQLAYSTLFRPLHMTFTEPVLFFSNLYITYVYGITYCLYVFEPLLTTVLKPFPLYETTSNFCLQTDISRAPPTLTRSI